MHVHAYHINLNIIGVPEFTIESLLNKTCCNRKAVTCFRLLSYADIETTRQHYTHPETETKQNQRILDYFIQHSGCDNVVQYSVAGKKVCETCWRLVCGVRYNKFSNLKRKFQKGVVTVQHGRQGIIQPQDRTLRMVCWLKMFTEKVGDRMPMSDDLHLPSCLTKIDIYNLANDDLMLGDAGSAPCISLSSFYDLWENTFSHVKIPKVCLHFTVLCSSYMAMHYSQESRFSTCDVCAAIREARECTLNRDVKKWLQKVLEKHMQLQRFEANIFVIRPVKIGHI